MNRMYGFRGEVTSKYSVQMADLFTEVYNWLPLAHCINSRVLIMHGGLFSSDSVTLDDIRAVDRNKQPPEDGKQFKKNSCRVAIDFAVKWAPSCLVYLQNGGSFEFESSEKAKYIVKLVNNSKWSRLLSVLVSKLHSILFGTVACDYAQLKYNWKYFSFLFLLFIQ